MEAKIWLLEERKEKTKIYTLNKKENKLSVYWMQYLSILHQEEEGNTLTPNELKVKEILEKIIKKANPNTNLLVLYTLGDTVPYSRYRITHKKIEEYEKKANVAKVRKALKERIKWV